MLGLRARWAVGLEGQTDFPQHLSSCLYGGEPEVARNDVPRPRSLAQEGAEPELKPGSG